MLEKSSQFTVSKWRWNEMCTKSTQQQCFDLIHDCFVRNRVVMHLKITFEMKNEKWEADEQGWGIHTAHCEAQSNAILFKCPTFNRYIVIMVSKATYCSNVARCSLMAIMSLLLLLFFFCFLMLKWDLMA